MATPREPEGTRPTPLPSIILILILQEVEDPRVERTRKHHLSDILFISLCAVICGCIIPCDAMGCQKNIAKEIIEADADYVLALKGNHETAHDEISTYLQDLVIQKEPPRASKAASALEEVRLLQSRSEVEKAHGRTTTRHYHQSDRIDWFEEKAEWEGLRSVGMVQTITEQNGKTTEEERYYLWMSSSRKTRAGHVADTPARIWEPREG